MTSASPSSSLEEYSSGSPLPQKPSLEQPYEFPDGGWECSKCHNYNFKRRKDCNRCKKRKTSKDIDGKPCHILKAEDEGSLVKVDKGKKNKRVNKREARGSEKNKKEPGQQTRKFKSASNLIQVKAQEPKGAVIQVQKVTPIRAGDWICQRCNNHNFSFRHTCNMCHLSHELSDIMLSIYRTRREPQGILQGQNGE